MLPQILPIMVTTWLVFLIAQTWGELTQLIREASFSFFKESPPFAANRYVLSIGNKLLEKSL